MWSQLDSTKTTSMHRPYARREAGVGAEGTKQEAIIHAERDPLSRLFERHP